MINIPLPNVQIDNTADLYATLMQVLHEIQRRTVDGTVNPLFVDYTNNRVIIGNTQSVGSNAPAQIQSGDIEITKAGSGVIIKDDGGSGHTCRITATYDTNTNNWVLSLSTVS